MLKAVLNIHQTSIPLANFQSFEKKTIVFQQQNAINNTFYCANTHRAEVNRDPLTAPKQDSPTKTGISQAITPRWYSPKLCQAAQNVLRPLRKQKQQAKDATQLQVVAAVTLWQTHDTHHGNGLGLDHLFRRDGGEVGQVGEDVHHRHYRHGYDDGQRQVPVAGRGQRSFEEKTSNIFFYLYMIVLTAFMGTGILFASNFTQSSHHSC